MCHHLRFMLSFFCIIVLRRKKRNQQECHTRLSMPTELINPTEMETAVYTVNHDVASILCFYVDV